MFLGEWAIAILRFGSVGALVIVERSISYRHDLFA
jgi:hypothetical protein